MSRYINKLEKQLFCRLIFVESVLDYLKILVCASSEEHVKCNYPQSIINCSMINVSGVLASCFYTVTTHQSDLEINQL